MIILPAHYRKDEPDSALAPANQVVITYVSAISTQSFHLKFAADANRSGILLMCRQKAYAKVPFPLDEVNYYANAYSGDVINDFRCVWRGSATSTSTLSISSSAARAWLFAAFAYNTVNGQDYYNTSRSRLNVRGYCTRRT